MFRSAFRHACVSGFKPARGAARAAGCLVLALCVSGGVNRPALLPAQEPAWKAAGARSVQEDQADARSVVQKVQAEPRSVQKVQAVARSVQEIQVEARSVQKVQAESLLQSVNEAGIVMEIDPQRSKIIRTKLPVTRVSVTNPDILEVVQFSPTEFELIGSVPGQTSLTFWFGDEQQGGQMLRYLVKVSPNQAIEDRRKIEYAELERKINELFPNSMVQLIPVANKLIVRGQARDAEEAAQIMAVLRGQGPDGQQGGFARLNQGPAAEPFPGLKTPLPTGDIVNLLQVAGEMQVMLKVRIAELSRTALRQMGAEFSVRSGDFNLDSLLGLGVDGLASAILETEDITLALQALSRNSYGKILAEPNLVTLSGQTAYFHAGGEFAVPVVVGVEGAAAATTNFRTFGTQLAFTPTVLDKDRIRLHVAPSFSTLNEENSVEGIPGLDSRSVATTVDLREGQWMAIAGLLQDQQSGGKTRVPFIGDIPVLGSVFSNKEVRREETELIVLVSPDLVHPLEAEQAPQILPGMEVTEPCDLSFFAGNSIEGKPDCHYRSTYWPTLVDQDLEARWKAKQQAHYQQSEEYYIHGQHGFSR